jgi:superoxide dismutase
VTIPMTIFIGVLLLVMIPYIYLRLFFRFLSLLRISTDKRENISKFGSRVISFILFAIFGVLILLFMWIKDIMFLMKILLDFEVIEIENFFYKKYSDDEKILYRKLVKDFIFMCE